ncbi:hypothetical protein M8J77_026238 [Diaphorina citri]|nr:hypothetical protein M8J77_026238 [Diaphorina citri]
MKEHRTKALRVTTTNAITSKKDDNNDLFGTLLQLELACLPSPGDLSTSTSTSSSSSSYCRLCHRRHHQYKPPDGASTVLQECSSCRNLPTFQFSDSDTFKFKRDSSLIGSNCSCPPCPLFSKLASRASGLSPLHALFAGDTLDNWEDILEQVRLIVETPHWLSCTDGEGNTPLLAGGRKLLKLGEFAKAEELARILLDAGSLPDDSNAEGRTLLAYSVTHMDESIQLSRLLINAGASVWPNNVDAASESSSTSAASTSSSTSSSALDIPTTPPPDSIFTSYLRAVMRKRKLDDACFQTLSLIAQAMGEQPIRMHAHVMRTMFDHARCVRVLGPVFLQMKLSMSQHWCQPQSLQTLCRTAFRSEAMRTKQKLNRESLQQIGLPLPLQKFVLYELTQ